MGTADYYAEGDWNAVCSMCGAKRKASTLVKNWQGMYRCPEHNEPRQPQDFVRAVPDIQTPPWVQPQDETFVPFCAPNDQTAIPNIGIPGCLTPGFISNILLPVPSDSLLRLGGGVAQATTPDSAALDITGSIEVRALVAMFGPTGGSVCSKWNLTGNQRAYTFNLLTDRTLQIRWSTNGTAIASIASTASIGTEVYAPLWVRWTFVVNDGAGNRVANFYTSTDYNPYTLTGTWTPLGATVTVAGTTNINNSTAVLALGGSTGGQDGLFPGILFQVQLFNGVGGILACHLDVTDAVAGQTSITGVTGELWTIVTGVTMSYYGAT